jgi:hypothetical protein
MALVLVHLAVATVHGLAHVIDGVLPPGLLDNLFILVVIYAAPLVAAYLLWRGAPVAGALLLTLSMAGAFCYGLAGHFLLPGSDNVTQQAAGVWPFVFQITAVLLAPLEVLGCAFGLRLVVITPRPRSARHV